MGSKSCLWRKKQPQLANSLKKINSDIGKIIKIGLKLFEVDVGSFFYWKVFFLVEVGSSIQPPHAETFQLMRGTVYVRVVR